MAHNNLVPNASSAMYQLGKSDGLYANQYCLNSLTVLDFGQPGYDVPQGGSANYGTYDFAPGNPFIDFAQVALSVDQYAQGWYDNTNSCPRLRVLVGANNWHECPFGGSCSVHDAGYALGIATGGVDGYLVTNNINWQVATGAADDIETDTSNGWDSAAKTTPFLDGYSSATSSIFYDYGTALVTSTWSDAQIYYATWGFTPAVPLPEIYHSGNLSDWTQLYNNHTNIYFYGVMTECASITSPPANGCANPYNEYGPSNAYANLYNNVAGRVQFFATNILKQ